MPDRLTVEQLYRLLGRVANGADVLIDGQRVVRVVFHSCLGSVGTVELLSVDDEDPIQLWPNKEN